MHCHPCDEHIPLDVFDDHVRVIHPHAWPIDDLTIVIC
jgi:hypothetical protein